VDSLTLLALRATPGLSTRGWLERPWPASVPDVRGWRIAERQLAMMRALEIAVVPVWELPEAFRRASPPAALFVRGDARLLAQPGLAIVGSRAASPEGALWAAARAREAVAAGRIVVSGGARGIDGAAHAAAVEAGGVTVAYVGVAVDRIYPAMHRSLFERLLERGGAIVSEHAPGEPTQLWHHADRNRFIAAQAERVLIAEADARSGALGTAEFARKLGVPVFTSPPGVGVRRAGLEALLAAGEASLWAG
jgi:DNA processing protein